MLDRRTTARVETRVEGIGGAAMSEGSKGMGAAEAEIERLRAEPTEQEKEVAMNFFGPGCSASGTQEGRILRDMVIERDREITRLREAIIDHEHCGYPQKCEECGLKAKYCWVKKALEGKS
jgi:hypothetical protein